MEGFQYTSIIDNPHLKNLLYSTLRKKSTKHFT